MPGALAQQCNPTGTYTVGKMIRSGKGSRFIEQTWNYYAYGDAGAGYTSTNYPSLVSCNSALNAYKAQLAANLDSWVNENMEAPIAGIESIPQTGTPHSRRACPPVGRTERAPRSDGGRTCAGEVK